MPEWVQNVARWNPMTWAVELGRGGLSGDLPRRTPGGRPPGSTLLAVLAFVWAVRSIRAYQRSV